MGLIIEDGVGTGRTVGVTEENRLKVSAVSYSSEHEVNHHNGQAYSLGSSLTPTGAGDCFLYIKNDSDTDMIITEFMLNAASDKTVSFKIGDSGTPVGGTTITPVNRNAGSGNEADITALNGVDITGLSGGSSVMGVFLKGGETSVRIAPSSTFIIPKNKVFTGYVSTGGVQVKVGMGISFHNAQH